MSEEFSFEVKPELIEELKKAINYDELNEISKRFDNGTETIDDIINHCRNYRIKFENGNQIFVVEKKYFDKVVDLYQKEKEKNKKLESLLRLDKRKRKNNTTDYSKLNKLNKFGQNGVCQDMRALKRKGITKYRAYITFQGKQYTLGSHDTLESAIKARKKAEETIKKLLEENNGKQM